MNSSINGEANQLKCVSPNESFTYFGTRYSPDGDPNHQLQQNIKDTRCVAQVLSMKHMNKYSSSVYLNTYGNSKTIYPLMCASLTSNNFKVVHRQYSALAISTIGYNKTWPV